MPTDTAGQGAQPKPPAPGTSKVPTDASALNGATQKSAQSNVPPRIGQGTKTQ
jgi:hypothetical protein